jgi:NitT/TauT family transport system substrate-binding protein
MRKLLTHLALSCFAVASVAACGSNAKSANTAQPSGGPSTAASAAPIDVRVATTAPTPALLPFYLAKEEGFYKQEGLNVSFVNVNSGAAFVAALQAGQLDVINSSLGAMAKAREGGLDLKIINGHATGLDYTLYARRGVKLPTGGTFQEKMAALKGLTIGTQGGQASLVFGFVKALMQQAGVDPNTVKVANVNFGGPMVAAMRSGGVDVLVADEPTVATADQLGLGSVYFSLLTDPPPDYQGLLAAGTATTQSFLAKHPDFAARNLRVMERTYAFMRDKANIDEMVRVATTVQGIPASDSLRTAIGKLGDLFSAVIPRTTLDKSIGFLYTTGQLSAQPRITTDQLFDQGMIK